MDVTTARRAFFSRPLLEGTEGFPYLVRPRVLHRCLLVAALAAMAGAEMVSQPTCDTRQATALVFGCLCIFAMGGTDSSSRSLAMRSRLLS